MDMLHFSFNSTLGAVFIGYTLEVALYGVTALQTFIYYGGRGSRDGAFLRSLVGFLFFLDTLHLALTAHSLYHYTVLNFTSLLALLVPVWSLGAQCMVTALSDLCIRFIFACRIWKLSQGNIWLATAIGITSSFSFAVAFAFGLKSTSLAHFTDVSHIKWLLISGLASCVAADAILAVALCSLLARSRSGFKTTDSFVNILIAYGISTGAVTVLCALIVLLTYVTMPNNFIWIAAFFVLGKLFLNSLLASLNARTVMLERSNGIPMTHGSHSHSRSRTVDPVMTIESKLAVRIDTEMQTVVDDPKKNRSTPWDNFRGPVVM